MIHTSRYLGKVAGLLALAGVSTTAIAQEPQPAGTFNDWSAYSYNTSKGKVCYIVSQPKSSRPDGVNRDPIHLLITHRPGDRVRNEVNTIIGYPFKKGSTATVNIDGRNYTLFTSGDGAWADSPNADSQLVGAMKAGARMTISGTSWRGTKTVDTYSLSGVTAAMNKIDQLCR